ncbi:MAG: SRPBCC family protein [Pyrinomonadaceae bacterium]
MFRVSAKYDGQFEIKAAWGKVRRYFADYNNFARAMPNVESITALAGGILRWVISADVPAVGTMKNGFMVHQTDNAPGRIEWSPAASERKNFLRYSAQLKSADDEESTVVQLTLQAELRRGNARELHTLAGLVGSARISAEMQKVVREMVDLYLARARRICQ